MSELNKYIEAMTIPDLILFALCSAIMLSLVVGAIGWSVKEAFNKWRRN